MTVRTPEQLADMVRALEDAEMISFDVETTGLERMTADVVGICLAVRTAAGLLHSHQSCVRRRSRAQAGQMNLFAGDAERAPEPVALDDGAGRPFVRP